jgi:drug/metabolite transporter (DMT)-like permease
MVAAICAGLFHGEALPLAQIPEKPWFTATLALGALFLLVFYITARTSQELGVSVASVASKMSLVLPVLLGIVLYAEILGPLKITGVILALAAVYFASIKESTVTVKASAFVLPVLLFLGSGLVDASIKYLQATYMEKGDFSLFSFTVFGTAGITGLLFILIRAVKRPIKVNFRNLLGGAVLGIFNFFSLFFLLRALEGNFLNSASIFTLNNVATVLLSTLFGMVLFRERLGTKNWLGIGLAVISIILVATT